jgi:hypothetical protein
MGVCEEGYLWKCELVICSISDLLLKEAFEDCKAGGLIRYRGTWSMATWRNSQRTRKFDRIFFFLLILQLE